MTHIYDKIFKKILTLSKGAVINLINGLYGTDHPTDSALEYNWTEFEDHGLKRVLADTILTIYGSGNTISQRAEGTSYHLEAQMTEDNNILLRVVEYGLQHALHHASTIDNKRCIIRFPEPKIIYLYCDRPMEEDYILTMDFGGQGTFDYHADTICLPYMSTEEINSRKMIILIPFFLLKLRNAIQKKRSPENKEALKLLISNDIIGSIKRNRELGNITQADARKLLGLTQRLYEHLYAHYEELEDIEEMDQSIILENEDLIDEMDRLENEKTRIQKENAEIQQQNTAIKKQNAAMQEELAKKDALIASLQEQLTALKATGL